VFRQQHLLGCCYLDLSFLLINILWRKTKSNTSSKFLFVCVASTIKKPSALPVSFDQFRKNPIAAVAFCMLVAVSYLYIDLRSGYKEQIEKSNHKIDQLDIKIDRLTYALKRSDSALASAITEIRIMNTMKKL
jgi:hypothetical protein